MDVLSGLSRMGGRVAGGFKAGADWSTLTGASLLEGQKRVAWGGKNSALGLTHRALSGAFSGIGHGITDKASKFLAGGLMAGAGMGIASGIGNMSQNHPFLGGTTGLIGAGALGASLLDPRAFSRGAGKALRGVISSGTKAVEDAGFNLSNSISNNLGSLKTTALPDDAKEISGLWARAKSLAGVSDNPYVTAQRERATGLVAARDLAGAQYTNGPREAIRQSTVAQRKANGASMLARQQAMADASVNMSRKPGSRRVS